MGSLPDNFSDFRPSSVPPPLLTTGENEAELFRIIYDKVAFAFHHSLDRRFAGYFSLECLREAAVRISNRHGHAYVESGTPEPGAKWGSASSAVKPASLSDAIDRIAENSFWVVLTRLHLDPQYAPVMQQVLDALSLLVGYRIPTHYYDPILTVLVTSPNRITPCHVDYDTNQLLQIQGSKEISIFDGSDAEIFPEALRERFWNGDTQAFVWKSEIESRALRVRLAPGLGVHVPAACPHWLQNGPEVSVSVSVTFKRRVNIVA